MLKFRQNFAFLVQQPVDLDFRNRQATGWSGIGGNMICYYGHICPPLIFLLLQFWDFPFHISVIGMTCF